MAPGRSSPLFFALRQSLREGYNLSRLKADLMAGAVVGVVAVPLSMALAIASGVPPQHGLYTAIIAGGVAALAGGSRVNVTGPTAAFVVLLTPIAARFGVGGLLLATAMAGVMLLGLGLVRAGRLISLVPYPVTTGFTAGIAVVIATLQLRDLLGLSVAHMPESYLGRVSALAHALPTARWPDLALGSFTLGLLILWPRVTRRVPAPLVALGVAGAASWVLSRFVPGFSVETIASRFGAIPSGPPHFALPWTLASADGTSIGLSLDVIRALAPSAFAIAMLGAIESLLCAVVADGMTGHKHDPDGELVAQGLSNLVTPFFGGIAATGALARTAANIRAGATSPVAALAHAVFVLGAMVLFAPLLGMLPMAALAALLLVVAWNMSEAKHFVHVVKTAPKSDVAVLLTCFLLTVVFDMVVSVSVGFVLASLLFMRRMAEVSGVRLVGESTEHGGPLPAGVQLYEIQGPLFFGAAYKAMATLDVVAAGTRAILLDMRPVPAIDATGIVNLESALERLQKARIAVYLIGVQPPTRQALERAGLEDGAQARFVPDVESAVAHLTASEPANPASGSLAPEREPAAR